MEQRLLIFAKKTREETRCASPSRPISNAIQTAVALANVESSSPLLSAGFVDSMQETLDSLRQCKVDDATQIASPLFIDTNTDSAAASTLTSPLAVVDSLFHPSNYHRLPPPPFPNAKFSIIMGDPSMQCREKLHGVWNPEDFDTRQKLVLALLEAGYTINQVRLHVN
jgi:hypothetical protein